MTKALVRTLTGVGLVTLALACTLPARAEGDAKPAKEKKQAYTGVVTAVDAKTGTIVLQKKEGDSRSFTLAPDCKFGGGDDKAKSLADYKVGDKVTAHYSAAGDKLTAHKLNVPQPAKKKDKEKAKSE